MIPELVLCLSACALEPYGWRETLDAIRQVETGSSPREGVGALGDGGKALGPYQIWVPYHTDAAERYEPMDYWPLNNYQKCSGKEYSEKVIDSYMNRYAEMPWHRLMTGQATLKDVETVARIHNGGPKGAKKESTLRYWRLVKRSIDESRIKATLEDGRE